MHTKKELDEKLRRAGISPLKKLGQNFLVNASVCEKIVNTVKAMKPACTIEIGPGLGALTDELLGTSKQMILVELDSGLVDYWQGELKEKSHDDVLVLHQDAMDTSWFEKITEKPAVLVSNLPYSIAASLIVEFCSVDNNPLDGLVLMFQKEVAERIQAQVSQKDYGMLSVVAQVFWTISKVIDAGPQDFHPVPNVGSRVLKFIRNESKLRGHEKEFISFVKAAFSQRRKKLTSNLSQKFKKENVAQWLIELGFDDNVRAEELSPEKFIKLFDLSQKS